jgi:hypothetical protein
MEERYPRQYGVLRQLWMDLERVKGWQHVEPRENAKLGLCYLYGWVGGTSESESDAAVPQIVVPCTTHEPLSMARFTPITPCRDACSAAEMRGPDVVLQDARPSG